MPPSSSLLLSLLLLPLTTPQSIGSFFTAIQYNNGPLPLGYSSCNAMGGSAAGYCCNNGHSCAWDDSGKVACCASGNSCSGAAGGGAYASYSQYNNNGGGACNTCQNVCNTCQQVATTVYVPQTTYAQQTSYIQTSYVQQSTYVAPVSPVSPTSVTVTVPPTNAGGVVVTTRLPVNQACGAGGYTTLTQANVGMPVRTVGCFVIFDAGAGRVREVLGGWGAVMGLLGWVLWWVV